MDVVEFVNVVPDIAILAECAVVDSNPEVFPDAVVCSTNEHVLCVIKQMCIVAKNQVGCSVIALGIVDEEKLPSRDIAGQG